MRVVSVRSSLAARSRISSSALKLFEDDLVHARAGVDERRGDNGQRAAFFDVAGRAKEALWLVQRVRVHTTGQDLARRRNHGVVGAGQTGDRVEQDHHVALALGEALGLFDHHLGNLDVTGGRLVEGRGNDLALDGALHVGHFFRALVDEQHHQIDFRVVRGDGVGDVLQKHRLTSARRRDDETALTLANRRQHIDDARRVVAVIVFEPEPLVWIQRRQVVEHDLFALVIRGVAVYAIDLEEREVTLAVFGGTNLTFDGVAGAQAEAANLRRRNVNVVGTGKVVVVGRAEETKAVGKRLKNAITEDLASVRGVMTQDLEDQVLASHARDILDVEPLTHVDQLGHLFALQLSQVHRVRSSVGWANVGRIDDEWWLRPKRSRFVFRTSVPSVLGIRLVMARLVCS